MKIAVTAVRCILGFLIGALILAPVQAGVAPGPADPDMGFQILEAIREDPDLTASKRQKLIDAVSQATEHYRAARFAEARQWFESAAQLDPDRPALQLAVEDVDARIASRRDLLRAVPSRESDRKAFLDAALAEADRLARSGEHAAAADTYNQIWMIAGDYEGRTLDAMSAARRSASGAALPERITAPAEAARDRAAFDDAIDPILAGPDSDAAEAMPAAPAGAGTEPELDIRTRIHLDDMNKRAKRYFHDDRLLDARKIWEQMLEIDPTNKEALTWLEQTAPAYEKIQQRMAAREEAEQRRLEAEKLLGAPISIQTERKVPLEQFMANLSFVTPVELEYYIVQGAEAEIIASFVDRPLRDVLDTILKPRGLTWSLDPKNVIIIEPNFLTRTYTLNKASMRRLRPLIDSEELQRSIWGQAEPPAEGVEITLDERQNILLVTGSQQHIERMENFLQSLDTVPPPGLEVRFYRLREKNPRTLDRIKALISSVIQATEQDTPFDEIDRKVLIDGNDLIIRDTLENINKIEELLISGDLIQDIVDERLSVENFSLVPDNIENLDSDYIKVFTSRVVEAVKTFLYAKTGETKASQEGRRLWYDEATLQLTIVDTPSNIERVSQFINSLPELGERQREEVVFIRFQKASDVRASLVSILSDLGVTGIAGGGAGTGFGAGQTVNLSRGDERVLFGTLLIRARRFEEDSSDPLNDRAQLDIFVNGRQNNRTLTEGGSETLEDYLLIAENISADSQGNGSIELTVRPVSAALSGVEGSDQGTAAPVVATDDGDFRIIEVPNLNALIFSFTDPDKYERAINIIDNYLDIPVKQVQIETRFVEVNETRAKEVSADFDIQGLGEGRAVDWSNQLINTRFAQEIDEYRDVFSPPIENPASSNLIKGTSVLSGVIGSFPFIQYSLRLLEAEGIINVVNGPKVLALNEEEAFFVIERTVPNVQVVPSFTFTDPDGELQSVTTQVFNPLGVGGNITQLANRTDDRFFTEEPTNPNIISAVQISMQPSITSENTIILNNLEAELLDFDSWLGELVALNQIDDPLQPTVAQTNISQLMISKRKRIRTVARISDGGTIVIGGWTGERSQELTSGVPILRNMPYLGRLLFSRSQTTRDRTTLLIFLTGNIVE